MSSESKAFEDFSFDDDTEVAGERPLTWFDVSAIGSGEMLATNIWAWIIFIALSFGIKWTLFGFVGGAVVIGCAWYLYREMVTAVPEPGMLQSYGREGKLFSVGTAYFLLYVPVYGAFMWLEFQVVSGLLTEVWPAVPKDLWPIIVIVPIALINLAGHQITGKIQSAAVTMVLAVDIVAGFLIWKAWKAGIWHANWAPFEKVGALGFFVVTALWLAQMAGILEVQQILVDEWREFKKSRDIGLPFAFFQLALTAGLLGIGVMGLEPMNTMGKEPVPTVDAVGGVYGHHWLYIVMVIFALLGTVTTFNVYFMAMGRILALYSMQGALPKIFARYSRFAVPWFSILVLLVLSLVGAYWTNWSFIANMLSTWSVTLYFFVALFFLRMRRNRRLQRPLKQRFGSVVAWFLMAYTAVIAYAVMKSNLKASLAWFGVVVLVVLYDHFVVPRTKRGKHYRAQVLRPRLDANRL
jgi:amino acid transporter